MDARPPSSWKPACIDNLRLGPPPKASALTCKPTQHTYKSLDRATGRPEATACWPDRQRGQRGHGLRARAVPDRAGAVRYCDQRPRAGDGFFSVSELAAYCLAPTPFPADLSTVAALRGCAAAPESRPVSRGANRLDRDRAGAGMSVADWGIAGAAGGALSPSSARAANGSFPLSCLFVASGCGALIYEIVWSKCCSWCSGLRRSPSRCCWELSCGCAGQSGACAARRAQRHPCGLRHPRIAIASPKF